MRGKGGFGTSQIEAPPTEDACSHFNHLEVSLELGNGIAVSSLDGAGTFDDILVGIGRYSFPLAEHPSRGIKGTRNIDLKKAFGSESVSVRDVSFWLYSKISEHSNPDSWELAGILSSPNPNGLEARL